MSGCLVAISVALWALGLATLDLEGMTDLGLVSVLPASSIAGLVLLSVSFAFTLRRDVGTGLTLIHVAALIAMLFAIPALVEPVPRFNVAWRHVGITEVLLRTEQIDPRIDAYFSWPGFFTFSAFVTQAAGLNSGVDLLPWAPVAFNALYLAPILLIFQAVTADRAVVWLGVWIFYLANWIGQDYYAPQAYGYFIYLLIIGLLLTYFHADGRPMWPIPRRFFTSPMAVSHPRLGPLQRAGLLTLILVMFGALSASHQLSPFALVGIVILLAVLGRITLSGLPAAMIVIMGTWISYMTVSYLHGHLTDMIARIGSVDNTVAANLTDRFRGSSDHLTVLVVRSISSVSLWSLAAVGSMRQLTSRSTDLTSTILAGAPFTLLLLQTYGGEMLLRVYLFSLPFMSVLAASAILGGPKRSPRRKFASTVAGSLLLLGSFLISRYGNERMDVITPAEAIGMAQLYEIAPPDSQLVALSDNVFWKYRDYELYHYAVVTDDVLNLNVPAIVDTMRARPDTAGYLILSRGQLAALQLSYSFSTERWEELRTDLERAPGVRIAYQNPDITIYSTIPSP
ncbi:MAG: hypothetical protein M3406_15965 [Chloroflexota bacterium]|nr:hypothetical protein [Chloroflexota bacterium]